MSDTSDDESNEEYTNKMWLRNYQSYVSENRKLDDPLPKTVKILSKPCGSKIYLVGTAHFSEESCREVEEVIDKVKPDFLVLELCNLRSKVLIMDETKLVEQCKDIDITKLIKKEGVSAGIMQYLLLYLSDHVMKEIKMLPGGEFRAAYHKAITEPYTKIILGDRPVDVTLKRTFNSLGVWGRLKFVFHLLTSMKPIKKEDIEKMKQSDILEELLAEMGKTFPQICKVLVSERDQYLAKSIWDVAQPMKTDVAVPDARGDGIAEESDTEKRESIPSITVAVVGIGHQSGIINLWDTARSVNKKELEIIQDPPVAWRIFSKTFKLGLMTGAIWIGYKVGVSVYNRILLPYVPWPF